MLYYFYIIGHEDLPDFLYVGSTTSFANRKYEHKSRCNNENDKKYNLKLYKTIRANGGWDKWQMICIAQVECETKTQAVIIEERYRLELNGNMNNRRCYITEEQRKEYDKEYRKKYYERTKK